MEIYNDWLSSKMTRSEEDYKNKNIIKNIEKKIQNTVKNIMKKIQKNIMNELKNTTTLQTVKKKIHYQVGNITVYMKQKKN